MDYSVDKSRSLNKYIKLMKLSIKPAFCIQHEVDRNQELLGRIKKLEERENRAVKNLSEQVESNRALQINLEGLNKKLEERDTRLNFANQVHTHTHKHYSMFLYSGHISYLMPAYCCYLFPDHQFFKG